jgi:hypothetical protein
MDDKSAHAHGSTVFVDTLVSVAPGSSECCADPPSIPTHDDGLPEESSLCGAEVERSSPQRRHCL